MMLREFDAGPGSIILDPFLGSGTTLLACKELGVDGVGIDVAPLAVFVSKVKIADYDLEELKRAASWLLSQPFQRPDLSGVSGFVKQFFLKPSLEDIIFFREKIREIENPLVRNFFT
ncbi:MAG: DNA methyltransferase, partial [Nitrososphaerota archaeon]